MPSSSRMLLPVAAAALALCGPGPAPAGDLGGLARGIAAPFRALHREKPATAADCDVERLAARIDWLEHQLDADGSIVAKEPDVWGQSRLMRHRVEYEEQMRRQLGGFTERSSAAIRRSDQAFLGMALAIQSAAGRRRGPTEVAVPDALGSASVVNSIQGLLPTTNEAVGRSDPVIIARTAPFAVPAAPAGLRFDEEPLALEPTTHLDQLSRYLGHLAALRRVNEGDDSADAPGYALNLVRIPVSIVPGARTARGHGAEITIRAEPVLGPGLLPTTFRNLVINDLVDMIAPALTWCVNDPDCVAWAETIAGTDPQDAAERQGVRAAMEAFASRLPAPPPAAAPAVKARRSRLPLPFTQLADVAGIGPIAILVRDTRAALGAHPANRPCIDYLDVRGHLGEELEAAWDFLAQADRRHAWADLAGWNLAALVRGRRLDEVAAIRCRFLAGLNVGVPIGAEEVLLPADDACCGPARPAPPLCRTTTAVLAWGILVESALLDDRLADDMRETAVASGVVDGAGCAGPFYGPDPAPEARQAFADYVRARWPVRVFALDPVREEQNVDDAYARRRELQIAMATAAATGRLNAQAMARYTRRLETDMAVVALNQTAVGFTHGADTFGWRFHPRVQTPPTRGTLATLTETVCGPSSEADLAQRALEPGCRECTALVVMPSFVPTLTFDVRTSWFSLAHPGRTEQSMRRTMELSRAVQALRHDEAACAHHAHLYRPGEVARLLAEVEKLDRRLPLQTLQARIPHENTAGGFELFASGVTDLAPELVGWYGAPGIDPAAATTLFLVGKGFSVHDTSVIAGGLPCRFTLVSREVLRLEVPPGVRTIVPPACPQPARVEPRRARVDLTAATEPLPAPPDEPPAHDGEAGPAPGGPCGLAGCDRREMVDVHLATPYGVSGHLLVPVSRGAAADGSGPAFADACRIDLSFSVAKTAGSRTEAARIDEYFAATRDALTIAVPASFIPPAKVELRLLVRDAATGATAAGFTFPDPPFDARTNRYVIAGGDLRNFVGDTSRPASDKTLRGALKPYLDHMLDEGLLAADGESAAFAVTAALVAGQQVVPVGGAIDVRATRRGRTIVEPRPDPATGAAP